MIRLALLLAALLASLTRPGVAAAAEAGALDPTFVGGKQNIQILSSGIAADGYEQRIFPGCSGYARLFSNSPAPGSRTKASTPAAIESMTRAR